MKYILLKFGFALTCALASALCLLPVMSGTINGTAVMARGFNLMEFSRWGCIPIIAPFMLLIILYGSQPKAAQELETLILFAGNMVCYTHSCNAAREWFAAQAVENFVRHPGILFYPMAFVFLIFLYAIANYNKLQNLEDIPMEQSVTVKRPECPKCHGNDWRLHINPRGYSVWKGLCVSDPMAEICNICGHIRYLNDTPLFKVKE